MFNLGRLFTLVTGLLVLLSLMAGAATIPPEIKNVVTFIFLSDANGNLLYDAQSRVPVANGTGFFVGVKSTEDQSRLFGYLVTAKHVLKNAQGELYPRIFVRLNKKHGDAEFAALDLIHDGKVSVYTHLDQTVDLAVVPASPKEDMYDFKVVPEEFLTSKESFTNLHIGEGSDVFFAGLFNSYYGDHRNNPIIRFGRVAMLPEDRILWQTDPQKPPGYAQLYLLEVQSYPGNSGSPVFFYLGSDRVPGSLVVGPPEIKLAGIMSGYFFASPAIRMIQSPTASVPITMPNSGIAAVTPSFRLYEILFSDQLKALRSQLPISNSPSAK